MKTAGICTKIRGVTSSKITLAAMVICAAGFARAAQFQPTNGGDLDDAKNWNIPSDTTFAILKAQSAALSISADNATLPNSAASLSYRNYTYTNNWTSGWTFSGTGSLEVRSGARLVHESGTMKFSKATGSSVAGTLEITGAESVVELGGTTVSGTIVVTNSAVFKPDMDVTVQSGGTMVCADGATISFSPDQNHAISVLAGGTLAVTNSSFSMSSNKANLDIASGATAIINGSALLIDNDGVKIGGDGGTLLFSGGASSISSRFTMTGDEFVFCVSNTTVNFASDSSSKLFITGSETSPTEGTSDRALKFCGANPHLVVKGTGGLFLRGSKTTLQFDLPRGDFTTDSVIEIPNASASFKGDSGTLAASQIVVNIDTHTTPGTYTLLKGKNAATFLTGANKWVTNSDRAVISANGNNEVVVTVKPVGLAIIVR